MSGNQLCLFETQKTPSAAATSSTFIDNTRLPVHRWFRYSAGFSARWAESVIAEAASRGFGRVLDPFAGSGTTLISGEDCGVPCVGIESHPFVARVARAKLARRSDPGAYQRLAKGILEEARCIDPPAAPPATLLRKCYREEVLADLDRLRIAYERHADGSPASELAWLTLVAILRKVSHVGTAQWQYVLPKKSKKTAAAPFAAFEEMIGTIYRDMLRSNHVRGPSARLLLGDARQCDDVPVESATLVITSPPYPNNYDYADATRLEMTFLREITAWGDLQHAVRKHLVRSCSQHVPNGAVRLATVLNAPELSPICDEISSICGELDRVRESRGGKKTYHLMIACYFLDLARVWRALRRVCDSPSEACFVIGDSAPYGVYVPVMDWMGRLALAAGFTEFRFEKTRDRNIKWKNRKHRVPLCEGRLWVKG